MDSQKRPLFDEFTLESHVWLQYLSPTGQIKKFVRILSPRGDVQ